MSAILISTGNYPNYALYTLKYINFFKLTFCKGFSEKLLLHTFVKIQSVIENLAPGEQWWNDGGAVNKIILIMISVDIWGIFEFETFLQLDTFSIIGLAVI